ncbi:MAG TPA: twin-arginine translocation signal domain-containing protein, partial [Blastocatellia bacterium]|nr:twin-arginine translocation signal domain-containing protein [Blastocatellia bacterium]
MNKKEVTSTLSPLSQSDEPATQIAQQNSTSPASPSRRKFLGNVSGATAATLTAGLVGVPVIGLTTEAKAEDAVVTIIGGPERVERAYDLRVQSATFQKIAPLPDHPNNGDEERYPNRIGNFS